MASTNYHTALTGTPGADITVFNDISKDLDQGITDNAAAIVVADPLTTKGDVYSHNATVPARLAVGATNGMVVTVDNAEATGLIWGPGPDWVAVFRDEKATTTNGGNSAAGAWTQRDLNTEQSDVRGIVSIGTNLFTPIAGDYLIEASAPGYDCGLHRIKLYNASTLADVFVGRNADSNTGGNVTSHAKVTGIFTANGSNAFSIQHYAASTKTNGFGQAVGDGAVEVYCEVKLTKIR